MSAKIKCIFVIKKLQKLFSEFVTESRSSVQGLCTKEAGDAGNERWYVWMLELRTYICVVTSASRKDSGRSLASLASTEWRVSSHVWAG